MGKKQVTFMQKKKRKELYEISYDYLCDNFHKFNDANKIKVALAVLNIFESDGSRAKSGDTYINVWNQAIKKADEVDQFGRVNIVSPRQSASQSSLIPPPLN